MLGPRTRNRQVNLAGSKNIYGSITATNRVLNKETTTDVVGYRHLVNYFKHEDVTVKGGLVNGSQRGSAGWRYWTNVPDALGASTFFLAIPSPLYTDQAAFNHAVAIANPSRAEVLTLAFIAELRDLPKLYHLAAGIENFVSDLGRFSRYRYQIDPSTSVEWLLQQLKPTLGNGLHHSRKVAVANLTLQFGMVPMIADIKTMLTVMMNFERRRREINQLYSGRGLRRKVKIGSVQTARGSGSRNFYSADGINFGTMATTLTSSRETWVTMRWKPDDPSALPPLDTELWRTMMGITPSHIASSAWEALPWSWFIDYFSNTGDVLAGLTNSIGAHMTMGAIMHKTIETEEHGSASITDAYGNSVSLSAGRTTRTTKLRNAMYLVSAAPSLPIISANQLSILGSLVLSGTRRQ